MKRVQQLIVEIEDPKDSNDPKESHVQLTSKRLEILQKSLEKKQQSFDSMIQNHFDTVKQSNGQPLNDKRNGGRTLKKWDDQNDSIRKQKEEVEKTERAIEKEKNKIANVEMASDGIPNVIHQMIKDGTLIQWRKYPNTFFVKGVDTARIIWDTKKKLLGHKYLAGTDKEQYAIFAKVYNLINQALKKK